ncbi:MAG: hypothetical protein ACFFC3_06805 [Candidatus Odinarchaeota archaeon]
MALFKINYKVTIIVRIKIIDGIACIELEDGIILSTKDLKRESKKLIMPDYFTDIQESKESKYYNKVLEEIKKKFGEK